LSKRINLNADLGEGCAFDAELMRLVTSCNIACGGHAGDKKSMETALLLAKQHGVHAGAHPSFPDRENFGRVDHPLRGDALADELAQQVSNLATLAAKHDIQLSHLKPHGALYNLAAQDENLAYTVAALTAKHLPRAALVGPPQSQLAKAAANHGLSFLAEGFADRAYEDDGQLRSRTREGAMLTNPKAQTEQVLGMVLTGKITTYSGHQINLAADTICIHGDTPGALQTAQALVTSLKANGVEICSPH
jgi:UPF0271 protein